MVDQSDLNYNKFIHEYSIELGQDLDIHRETTVEDVPDVQTIEQNEYQCNGFERGIAEGVDQALVLDGETVNAESGNIADSSMEEEMKGNESLNSQCASENVSSTDCTRGRKRTRNPLNWKRNQDKKSCNSGKRYVNSLGNLQQAKKMKKGCGLGCRFKCQSVFTEEDRENIFNTFWKLGDPTCQRQYLLKYSAPQRKKTKTLSSYSHKRENSFM